ncbi:MAG TPA: hypothetical protein VNW97_05840 [Candidatus Saccharimonadales bacterium]|jgi:hypothetical protein|nr:hypothetical protein [Candidatus Saccharimonadales bacterium]
MLKLFSNRVRRWRTLFFSNRILAAALLSLGEFVTIMEDQSPKATKENSPACPVLARSLRRDG